MWLDGYTMEHVGFIVSLQGGTEWTAKGTVSQCEIPDDFPKEDQTGVK